MKNWKKKQLKKNHVNFVMCFVIWQLLKMAFAYEYTGYLSNIHSVKAYFDANLDMLESQKFYKLFAPNQKVYTKVKNEEPTYYAASSEVKVSQFASGSIVRGKVEHSVVSRNVDLA